MVEFLFFFSSQFYSFRNGLIHIMIEMLISSLWHLGIQPLSEVCCLSETGCLVSAWNNFVLAVWTGSKYEG